MFLPRGVGAFRGRSAARASVEERCRNHEQAEEDDLDDETGDDDVGAHV